MDEKDESSNGGPVSKSTDQDERPVVFADGPGFSAVVKEVAAPEVNFNFLRLF
jgi:hypothetical protein